MTFNGIKKRVAIDIINTLFGEPAAQIGEFLIDYGPCPLGFIIDRTGFSSQMIKSILLSFYTHGIINIKTERGFTQFSLNTFPIFILSNPSLLLEAIYKQYSKGDYVSIMAKVLEEGISLFRESSTEFSDFNEANEKMKIGKLTSSEEQKGMKFSILGNQCVSIEILLMNYFKLDFFVGVQFRILNLVQRIIFLLFVGLKILIKYIKVKIKQVNIL